MSAPIFPSTWQIPIDFMIRKGHLGIIKDNLKVYDAYGNKLYRVTGRSSPSSSSSSHRIKTLFDVHGSPMISVVRRDDGWQCFRGNNWDREDSVFTAKIVYDYKFRSELEVFLSGKEIGDQIPNFTLKGNRFWRSCTIYSRDSIVAQTNPLYRLGRVIYSRHKFRLTVYPGIDHSLVIAMLITFFG
ncbi:protein LURP-one-related 7 [Asparagus officinalis]|uniref:protein LURP-one-related 7 n=1 Tax=Asparagus officinalis TaxID=4686 RepID=UPI00098E771E|nr:protein LURP-one-related 7 [Asparagus officinalis]